MIAPRHCWLMSFALLAGCATSGPFQPTENAKTSLDKGPSFARYDVRTGDGDFGMVHVNLKTSGLQEMGPKDNRERHITLEMEINNDSSKTIYLDRTRVGLQLIVDKTKQENTLLPVGKVASTIMSGHSQSQYEFDFVLPANLKSSQVSAFEFLWGLSVGEERYTQATGFSRDSTSDEAYTVYDPFYYPYASYGYMYGPHHHSRSNVNLGVGLGF